MGRAIPVADNPAHDDQPLPMSIVDQPVTEASALWPEIDRRFLHNGRPPPPPFPLELLPEHWRPWVEARAPSFTSLNYLAQGLLGAVSAVCGARVAVDVTPHWREPLVLWQALVGRPSTGKTPALMAARQLVESIGHPPGATLWCDDLAAWLAERSDRQESSRRLPAGVPMSPTWAGWMAGSR
jgi:hypothetical protein